MRVRPLARLLQGVLVDVRAPLRARHQRLEAHALLPARPEIQVRAPVRAEMLLHVLPRVTMATHRHARAKDAQLRVTMATKVPAHAHKATLLHVPPLALVETLRLVLVRARAFVPRHVPPGATQALVCAQAHSIPLNVRPRARRIQLPPRALAWRQPWILAQ